MKGRKVFLGVGISPSDMEGLKAVADKLFDGNLSLAARKVIRAGLDDLWEWAFPISNESESQEPK